MDIRAAKLQDLAEVEAIYQHYVETSIVTFEEPDTRSTNFEEVFNNYLPFLVAVDSTTQKITGYAYAKPFHDRAAYRTTVEHSVYIDPTRTRERIGRALLKALLTQLGGKHQVQEVVSAIALLPSEDHYDNASCRMHYAVGFRPRGRLLSVGYKLDKWIDVMYWQLSLGGAAHAEYRAPMEPSV